MMFLFWGVKSKSNNKNIIAMTTRSKENSFKGKNIYVGIDVHLKSWTATVLSDTLTLKTFRLDPSPEVLCAHLFNNYPEANYFSVYEAGFSGYSVHRRLCEMGVKNIVVNPADVPTTNKEKLRKTDSSDSAKLARSLRAGEIKPIYVPDTISQELRSLSRHLQAITKDKTRIKNRIKGHLRFLGIEIPQRFLRSANWSYDFIDWLKRVCTDTPYGKFVLDSHIRQLEEIRDKKLNLLRYMRAIAKEEPLATRVKLLLSVPGIGEVTSLRIASEVIDIKRFNGHDQLAAFIGIVPMCHKSGDDTKEDNGGITTRANRTLRSAIIEAAWIAAGKDPALTLAFENYCKRMKKTDAIVRIARKIVNRIYFVLKHEMPYVPSTY